MTPTETGLIIPVPSFQDFVDTWRPAVDGVPPVGVPAHVTVLYPFLPPTLAERCIDELGAFFAAWPRFTYSLEEIGWFDDQVVFVRPRPTSSFVDLTNAVEERWGLPPYRGEIQDPQPHVTIGREGSEAEMRRVAAAASELLPVETQVADQVWLMQGTPDPPHWAQTHRFDLGAPHP